jgi:phosphoribosylformylglycinamidine synthase PurS subunit
MNFKAAIDIMPHKELLDPQGKAVANGLQKMGFESIEDVRVGRHITLTFSAKDAKAATALVEDACKKLLANAIMEGYSFELSELK